MKNLTLFFLLLVGLTFSSCSDDEVTPTPVETPFITANINDVAFEAASIEAIGDDSFGDLLVFTSGTNAEETAAIGLNIPATITIDEAYEVDENDFGITYGNGDEETAYITIGTINVSEFDSTAMVMRGTFSFIATNEDDDTEINTVTDGAFFIEYQ